MATTEQQTNRLLYISIAVSLVLIALLAAVYWLYDSQLALAQTADSIADALTAAGFVYSLKLSLRPPDDDHPWGHTRAELVGVPHRRCVGRRTRGRSRARGHWCIDRRGGT